MRWIIGITLFWFIIVNAANIQAELKAKPDPGPLWIAILGGAASLIGLLGLVFKWGI